MQFIRLIFESFCRSLIRFFDNRFVRDTSVEYYRIEMEKLRQESNRLLEILLAKSQPMVNVQTAADDTEWQPAREGFKSWETKRRELEQLSFRRAAELEREAKRALASTKSTAELEAELLSVED